MVFGDSATVRLPANGNAPSMVPTGCSCWVLALVAPAFPRACSCASPASGPRRSRLCAFHATHKPSQAQLRPVRPAWPILAHSQLSKTLPTPPNNNTNARLKPPTHWGPVEVRPETHGGHEKHS
ncbi:hypothetical protein BKA56DRAFT_617527 [Ilyonectria sp. MPI-CAGE-AT-0026]|nr:hypothetical protein BKA56DRAFT_617527 [Ilyonectria sp. MPI-CAGE-AT-0026]